MITPEGDAGRGASLGSPWGMQGWMDATDQKRTIGGRYRLDRSIGAGGMGTVWEGYDELLGRPVAVKEVRFPPELGDREVADLRERTMREARATARLSHPNVVTTYDVVEEDNRPWIVMELLASRSLAQILREDGPLPPARVAQVGLDMLGALESSHGQGVVHRDVKPSNVLIAPDGRAGADRLRHRHVGRRPGADLDRRWSSARRPTCPPSAPAACAFGPESDLWSLGATLFAAAEGRPPFETDNALGTLTSVIADPVPPLSAGGPLADAVEGLLRKDPADRAGIPETREALRRATAERAAPVATTLRAPVAAYGPDQGRTQVVDAAALGSPSTTEPSYAERPPQSRAADRRAGDALPWCSASWWRWPSGPRTTGPPRPRRPREALVHTEHDGASHPTTSSPPPSTTAPVERAAGRLPHLHRPDRLQCRRTGRVDGHSRPAPPRSTSRTPAARRSCGSTGPTSPRTTRRRTGRSRRSRSTRRCPATTGSASSRSTTAAGRPPTGSSPSGRPASRTCETAASSPTPLTATRSTCRRPTPTGTPASRCSRSRADSFTPAGIGSRASRRPGSGESHCPTAAIRGRYSNGGQDVGQSGPRGAGDAGRSASRGAVTRQGRSPGHRPGPW